MICTMPEPESLVRWISVITACHAQLVHLEEVGLGMVQLDSGTGQISMIANCTQARTLTAMMCSFFFF